MTDAMNEPSQTPADENSLIAERRAKLTALRAAVNEWAAEHQRQLGVAGTSVVQVGVRVLIGMVLGAMIALYDELPLPKMGPLAQELVGRTTRLAVAFRQVVFAQVKISLLNTLFTAIFLLGVLPLFGGEFIPPLREGHYIVHLSTIPGTAPGEVLRVGQGTLDAIGL